MQTAATPSEDQYLKMMPSMFKSLKEEAWLTAKMAAALAGELQAKSQSVHGLETKNNALELSITRIREDDSTRNHGRKCAASLVLEICPGQRRLHSGGGWQRAGAPHFSPSTGFLISSWPSMASADLLLLVLRFVCSRLRLPAVPFDGPTSVGALSH